MKRETKNTNERRRTLSLTAADEDIREFLKDKSFSAYVKELIRKDMNSSKEVPQTVALNLSDLINLLGKNNVEPVTTTPTVTEPTMSEEKKLAAQSLLNRRKKN